MLGLIAQSIALAIRWIIYLAFIGELAFCTMDLRKNAEESVSTGLLSLGKLNRSLHKK